MSETTSEPLLPALRPATISGPAPEPAAAPSTEEGAKGEAEETEGAGEAAAAAVEQTPEQKAEAEQKAAQERQKKSAAARIGAAVRAQREAERERDALAARVKELEAKDPAKAAEQLAEAQIDLKAAEKAQQMLAADAARVKAETFQNAGAAEFPDNFDELCNTVAGMGATARRDFVPVLLDLENGHRAIAAMAEDQELTEKILKMPTHKMAIELQKLADKVAAPKPKPVSNAPAPIKKTAGVARGDGYRSDFTMQEHLDWVKKNQPYRN